MFKQAKHASIAIAVLAAVTTAAGVANALEISTGRLSCRVDKWRDIDNGQILNALTITNTTGKSIPAGAIFQVTVLNAIVSPRGATTVNRNEDRPGYQANVSNPFNTARMSVGQSLPCVATAHWALNNAAITTYRP